MSQVLLTVALGLITTSLIGTRQNIAIPDRSLLSPNAKSWLGFLVFLGLAAGSITTAVILHPEQAAIPYG